jgi:hypothetical protein
MRALEPFGYFAEHASALVGFGGVGLGPDPRYCLHTFYEEVKPGRAVFHVRLDGAKASAGELTFRVHSYKPGAGGDVSLAASTRSRLDRIAPTGGSEQIDVAVRIVAVEGVRYALYGYFSEPSDLVAREVSVLLEEFGPDHDDGLNSAERPVSKFQPADLDSSHRQLVSRSRPTLASPDSRDCTHDQLDRIGGPSTERISQWRRGAALTALEGRDMLDAEASGLLLGPAPEGLPGNLAARACIIETETPSRDQWFDFAISYELEQEIMEAEQRIEMVHHAVGRLMHGGLAVMVLAYDADASALTGERGAPTRNEIGRWALHLIGAGHSVAPISFARRDERAMRSDGLTPFVLVVRHG